ncbi:MAG: M56 family metallopeptidase [Gammaproteobacteria bacterium]|nr:M56 family metallopeptidase [Gammaproteobacteria bacterium]MDP2347831.1 M56 family metallopeptidase [Gammaproteobacteria bacterium]
MNTARIPFLDDLSAVLGHSPTLQLMLDLLFKSTLLIGLTLLIGCLVAKRSGGSHRHLLWINSILCLALLPLIPVLLGVFSGGSAVAAQIFNLSVVADSAQFSELSDAVWGVTDLWLFFLLIPSLFLFVRLCLSLLAVLKISRNSTVIHDEKIVSSVNRIRDSLQISRNVLIRKSSAISSPFSFGIMHPAIVLPSTCSQWSDSVLEDVLVHELSHIRRLDWVSMLLCHLVLCVYWFNPLVWLAVRKVDEEAENSCDAAVIRYGKSNTEYAENLLLVARECRNQKRLLAQMIVDKKLLSNRITTILENSMMMKTISRKMLALSAAVAATLLVGLGNVQLLAVQAQDSDQEMYPLATVEPVYPRRAAEEEIEGWVWVRFDVNPDGSVREDSISIVDSEPAAVFDGSARAATTRFTFSPRLREGTAVTVENVEYVFRFQIREYEDNQAWLDTFTGRRPPTGRRPAQN